MVVNEIDELSCKLVWLRIDSVTADIARNYVHKESLDCLIILIQTLFLLFHIQAVLDKR